MSRLSRKNCSMHYGKWFHHIGTFRVVKKKSGNGELRMIVAERSFGVPENWVPLTDSHLMDVFVWLGRYLALKGKLPRNIALEEIAVGAQRTAKAIREVNAMEIYRNEVSQIEAKKAGK